MMPSPSISVVVVNLNGRELLGDCLDALEAQDYPRDRREIVLVDNGSTDSSVAFVREAYPDVRVVEAGRNLGFAGGNNLGAQVARGDYLALINNDAHAAPQWLSRMTEALEGEPPVACAASRILDWEGEVIDYVGPAMNLYGRAFHVDQGVPVGLRSQERPRELLAPCGGAMMIRREVFQRIGGFDDDYLAYFEDLDLGWRLWILGYRVLFVPDAVVRHRQHKTGTRFPVEQRYVLSEINALRTVIKNYEDENLWRVLPVSLFLGVKRSLDQARLRREKYEVGYEMPGDPQAGALEPEPQMTRVATSFLVAIDQVADEMPRLLEKRRCIQEKRVRSDQDIFARFPIRPDNWLFPWRRYHVVQDRLVEELGVPRVLKPQHGSHLLIITHETVGPRMAGPGIRAWEMARALSDRFDVTLAARGEPGRDHPALRVVGFDADDESYADLNPHIDTADVVLAMGSLFSKIPRLRDLEKPAIVDLYDPFELEKLEQARQVDVHHHVGMDVDSRVHLRLEGGIGDFFICASERQRDFWLGTLLSSGRVNTVTYAQDPTMRDLIDVVPFGVPSRPPQKQHDVLRDGQAGIDSEDKVLLWNGGLWQWFDPLTLVDALVEVLRVREDVKLYFAAGRHFDPETVPEMPIYAETLERCRELGLLQSHVFFGDWVPYDERGDYLLEADLGVTIHEPGLESRFASRTRILDCIWAGLPVLATTGDPLSEVVEEERLGRVVPPKRPDLLAQAILEMLGDEHLRDRVAERARRFCRLHTWSQVVEPIGDFLDRAAFAPDALQASRVAAEARRIDSRLRSQADRIGDLEREVAARAQTVESQAARIESQAHRIETLENGIATLEREKEGLQSYVEELRAHIRAVNQGRVMRLMRAINIALGREEQG